MTIKKANKKGPYFWDLFFTTSYLIKNASKLYLKKYPGLSDKKLKNSELVGLSIRKKGPKLHDLLLLIYWRTTDCWLTPWRFHIEARKTFSSRREKRVHKFQGWWNVNLRLKRGNSQIRNRKSVKVLMKRENVPVKIYIMSLYTLILLICYFTILKMSVLKICSLPFFALYHWTMKYILLSYHN